MNEAKQKAKELVERFQEIKKQDGATLIFKEEAKQCALIACDEILNTIKKDSDFTITYKRAKVFWQSVKQEVETL